MTDKLRQAIEQTVAILGPEAPLCSGCVDEWTEALRILRAALAEQPAEPVAYVPTDALAQIKPPTLLLRGVPLYGYAAEGATAVYTAPQPAIPPGYKLVPVEPTPEMKTAGIAVEVYPESKPEIGALTWAEVKAIYSAMLAAAPQPAGEPVASAVQTLIEAMQADPDYAWGWHCNIAMAFVDAGGSHYTANQGAARFMRMLANVEPAHELPAAPQPHPDDTALLRQALEFMNELLPATSEISAEHLSDPTLLRDLELRDAIMERLK
ncbi:hypothetical protein [Hydrogenophaga aquatica]